MNASKTNRERFAQHYSIDSSEDQLQDLYERIGKVLDDYKDFSDDELEKIARFVDQSMGESDELTMSLPEFNEYVIAEAAIREVLN